MNDEESKQADCPECHHPVARHTAWWGGCKYCHCGKLPVAEAAGLLHTSLKGFRRIVNATTACEVLDKSIRIQLDAAIEAAIKGLHEKGFQPLVRETDAMDNDAD